MGRKHKRSRGKRSIFVVLFRPSQKKEQVPRCRNSALRMRNTQQPFLCTPPAKRSTLWTSCACAPLLLKTCLNSEHPPTATTTHAITDFAEPFVAVLAAVGTHCWDSSWLFYFYYVLGLLTWNDARHLSCFPHPPALLVCSRCLSR